MRIKTVADDATLDRLGVAASCACALHCLLTPLLIGLLPVLGLSLFADERAEWSFIALSVGLGLLSLLPSYFRHHRRLRPVVIFTAGACLIFIARLLLEENSRIETSIVVIGALLVAAAHFFNLKLCRLCTTCPTDCE